MELDIESRNVVALHGSRIPEMLGSFHLDDHNVQEWSDASKPGTKHRARKEVGKWIDSDKNADIQFQRHEDSTHSDRSREQQRTEVIQGNAPDAAFQIVRSQRQFQDNDDKSGSRVSSVSTSYQMSSTRGIRSTTKTTSNKTTTKTVTVSGGRSDDFENLKMSFQPLDTSTQRERINVSRSGTMGVRRPPTRRHTPAALLSSSPEELQDETVSDATLIHESDEFTSRMSEYGKLADPAALSIVGFKNLSPKIRVGFPVEIQLELQSKLRYSNGDVHESHPDVEDHTPAELREESSEIDTTRFLSSSKSSPSTTTASSSSTNTTTTTITTESQPTITSSTAFRGKMRQQESTIIDEAEPNSQESIDANESADALFHAPNNSSNNNDLTFDFSQRRKSYGFESFETKSNESVVPTGNSEEPANRESYSTSTTNINRVYNKVSASSKGPVSSYERPVSNLSRISPSSLSRSWDLIQSVANEQQRREANKKLFSSSSDLDDISHSFNPNNNKSSIHNKYPQKTIITLNPFEENEGEDSDPQTYASQRRASSPDFTVDSLEPFLASTAAVNQRISQSKLNSRSTSSIFNVEKTHKIESPPDVIHHNIMQTDFAIPEKSRKLMKLLDETPDLLNKMSFKNHIPPSNSSNNSNKETLEIRPMKRWEETETPEDKEFQSNLSYLNESLSRILGEGKDLNKLRGKGINHNNNYNSSKFSFSKTESTATRATDNNLDLDDEDEDDMFPMNNDRNRLSYDDQDFMHSKASGKPTQVSQTWISDSIDQKPSQHARDNDVTTSISGTNDQYRKAQKKVEFCKTEVHFTPDSGKFHIVETDENKPSTVHLFRRKKKNEKKTMTASSTVSTTSKTTETKKLIQNISETRENDSRPKDPTDEQRKLSSENTSHTSTRSLFSRSTRSDDGSEGLELIPLKSEAVEVGVDKDSLFHSFTGEQDSKPEFGINEASVTPTTANNLGSSLNYLNHHRSSNQHMHMNITDNDEEMLGSSELLPPFKLRRDDILIPDDFDPLIQEKAINQKRGSHVHNNNRSGTVNQNTTTLIDDLLDCLGEDGDEADESRSDMILSNYGELKIQRYLKQLKSPSSNAGSESPTDFLQLDDGDPDDEDAAKHFRFDNVLYENGSFVPLATRRSLIEMNNRNRKRGNGGGTHFHSDNSSTITSNYSLPNSDRESNFQGDISNHPLKLTAMEATVATGPKPQITSVELKYALDSGNSYFSEPVKRNFKTPNSKHSELEKVYDVPTAPVKPELRSLPPYNRNGRFSLSSSPAGMSPTRSPTRESNSYKNSKPPVPILPSKFSSFEKTGAALRERSYAKKQNSDLGISLPDAVDKYASKSISNHYMRESKPEPKYIPSKSIVNIGGDENIENISKSTTVNLETDYNLTISHDASFPRSISPSQNNDEDDQPGEEEITISPEPILSMDHTWKGPAHFDNHGGNKGASVIRSLTFPKATRPEPEWVSKARSRESRVTDWSLVGKQYGTTVTNRKSEPPWISEIRFKSKPVIPAEEIEAIPKASVVYPWQPDPTPSNQSSGGGGGGSTNREVYSPTELVSENISFAHENSHHIQESGQVIITELPDGDSETTNKSSTPTGLPPNIINDYYNSSSKNLVDLNRDSDSILITPTHISVHNDNDQTGSTRKEKKSHSQKHSHNPDYADVDNSTLDKKLLAPLTESTKPPRKPLQTSSSTNKKINHSNNNNSKLPPTGKPKAPPRPPKPPERISSLGCKSQPVVVPATGRKLASVPKRQVHNQNNNNNSNSSDVEEAILNSRSNTPIHRHPLVKVTKIPTTASTRVTAPKVPNPEAKNTSSKNKAKHHVSVVSETKLMCKSKLMDSPSTYKVGQQTDSQHANNRSGSRRLHSRVPTVYAAAPYRKR